MKYLLVMIGAALLAASASWADGPDQFVAVAALAAADTQGASKDVLEECAAQVRLMNADALKRLADDWAQTPGADANDVAAVRAFAAMVESEKKAAGKALAAGDDAPARALLARQRRSQSAAPRSQIDSSGGWIFS